MAERDGSAEGGWRDGGAWEGGEGADEMFFSVPDNLSDFARGTIERSRFPVIPRVAHQSLQGAVFLFISINTILTPTKKNTAKKG